MVTRMERSEHVATANHAGADVLICPYVVRDGSY
jgi:hypothetical protein